MKQKYFSLSVQILTLCLVLVLVISSTITAIFYSSIAIINSITHLENVRV
jgi:hypothetical protein